LTVPAFVAGQIVLADWRDGLPREPNKLRPAVVVHDSRLFDPDYPNVILVPLSENRFMVAADLSVVIEPTPENGFTKRCYALSPSVAATSARRIRATDSRVLPVQLAEIRWQIGFAIGLE
jgi:mRNA-degrading endonuclease toxin of MazEF toxin-antitoxin module